MFLANYVGGNVAVYPIRGNGLLGEPTAKQRHHGASVNPDRQEGPHPHAIVPGPDNRLVFVPDLGIDKIVAYRFEEATGALTPAPKFDVFTPPGSGPRHFVFCPDGRAAYCSLELSSQLAVYTYAAGKLTLSGLYSTLPKGYTGESTNAEVRASPDGRHVYVSNRGHDSVAVFAVDNPESVRLVEIAPSGGATPRNFGISPDGAWVVVGNQDDNNLVCFRRDAQSGRLTRVGDPTRCATPALICFLGQ